MGRPGSAWSCPFSETGGGKDDRPKRLSVGRASGGAVMLGASRAAGFFNEAEQTAAIRADWSRGKIDL